MGAEIKKILQKLILAEALPSKAKAESLRLRGVMVKPGEGDYKRG